MESVIWPTIIYLNDPEAATNTNTNMTPIAMRDDVKKVLLLYLDKFRIAILKSLCMLAYILLGLVNKYPIVECINCLHFTDDLWVMRGKDKCYSKFLIHLSHNINNHESSLAV